MASFIPEYIDVTNGMFNFRRIYWMYSQLGSTQKLNHLAYNILHVVELRFKTLNTICCTLKVMEQFLFIYNRNYT